MEHNLGDRYYLIDRAGQVTAHVILNLPFKTQETFFNLDEVAALAESRLAETISLHGLESTSSPLPALLEMIVNDVESFKGGLQLAPVFFFQPSFMAESNPIAIDVGAIPKPESYFQPGTVVFAAITPNTPAFSPRPLGPAPFFILETTVTQVSWGQRGLQYHLDSEFQPINPLDIRSSLTAAKARLRELIERIVPSREDQMLVHTIKDEMERREESAQHRFGRLSAGAD